MYTSEFYTAVLRFHIVGLWSSRNVWWKLGRNKVEPRSVAVVLVNSVVGVRGS